MVLLWLTAARLSPHTRANVCVQGSLDRWTCGRGFFKNLKAGRLDQINWDKEYLVPMLQLISTETVKSLSLEQLLCDSDRFAFFKGASRLSTAALLFREPRLACATPYASRLSYSAHRSVPTARAAR